MTHSFVLQKCSRKVCPTFTINPRPANHLLLLGALIFGCFLYTKMLIFFSTSKSGWHEILLNCKCILIAESQTQNIMHILFPQNAGASPKSFNILLATNDLKLKIAYMKKHRFCYFQFCINITFS
jgi:hypothetical protein